MKSTFNAEHGKSFSLKIDISDDNKVNYVSIFSAANLRPDSLLRSGSGLPTKFQTVISREREKLFQKFKKPLSAFSSSIISRKKWL